MQTNKLLSVTFGTIALIFSSAVVSGQEVGTNITTPCVSLTVPVAYYFIPADQCQPTSLRIRNAIVNVDYQVVNSSTGSITVNWLKPTTTAIVEIDYNNCMGGGGGTAFLPVVVNAATPSLPATSFTLTASCYQEINLSIPGYTRPLRWFDNNNVFIKATSRLNVGYKAPGTYSYKVVIIVESGECGPISTTTAPVTLQVSEGTDNELNWTETVVYNEQAAVIGNSRSYFAHDGRPLQSQTKNLTGNEVLASQAVEDQLNRPAIQTLSAPINRSDFKYHRTFVTAADGTPYSSSSFDQPVGNSDPGTLGWYYSPNNTKEQHVPVTGYPYSRTQFYDNDGSAEVRRVASAGDQHRLGQGHEIFSATFPVGAELDDYYAKRSFESLQFANPGFDGGVMGPWENMNPFGSTTNQNFQWISEGTIAADATSSGYSQTSLLGQKRKNGAKWKAGNYTVRITASNFSTGGMEPLASGLAVYASNSPTTTATNISYTGNGTLPVSAIGASLVVSFTLATDFDYILFNFNKQGPSSGYRVKILVSEIIMLVAAGTPVTDVAVLPADKGVQTLMKDQNGNCSIGIKNKSGNTVMTATKGSSDDFTLSVVNYVTLPRENINSWYFYLLNDQVVSGMPGTGITVEDLATGLPYSPAADGDPEWEAGAYRVLYTGPQIQLTYTNYYKDVSYNFYNDVGALVTVVTPNGMAKLKQGVAFTVIDKTTYQYNYKGWLTTATEPDAGTTEYKYRRDGKIRFSQDARQRSNALAGLPGTGKFSYTVYDELGRPKESGEYKGTAETFAGGISQLEFGQQKQYPAADIVDWVKTYYDQPASSIPNLPATFKQQFVRNVASWTENVNIRTWYSYDEMGRVQWMAQKPTFLNAVFVSQYTYDVTGKLITVLNSSYDGGGVMNNPFYHHYEYDADQRLIRMKTSRDGTNKQLRVTYEYYLHGPLKRIELGDGIQGIDLVYNINGWLRQINHPDKAQDPGGDGNDVFGLLLDYYESSINNLFQSTAASQGNTDPNYFHRLPGLDDVNWKEAWAYAGDNTNLKEILHTLKSLKTTYGQRNGRTAVTD